MDNAAMKLLGKMFGGMMNRPTTDEEKAEIREKYHKKSLEKINELNSRLVELDRAIDVIEAPHINATVARWISEVGEWAYRNFGDNNGLHMIAPLLGAVEEMGEFSEAIELPSDPSDEDDEAPPSPKVIACEDAVADRWIFLFDFCNRLGIRIEVTQDELLNVLTDSRLVDEGIIESRCVTCIVSKDIGKLCHVMLKMHQGIRGIDPTVAREQATRIVKHLFLADLRVSSFHLMGIIDRTWKEVRKRDWKKNPTDAHKVVDDPNVEFANLGDGEE